MRGKDPYEGMTLAEITELKIKRLMLLIKSAIVIFIGILIILLSLRLI